MVDIKVWTWVPEMGLPPYGNSKEAVNDVSHTGSFLYTMSCQTIDTENEEVMKAFDPNFEGERNAVSMLIPHTIMLEVEGKVCNEDPDKATVSRNWSANYYVWDRRRQLMRNAKYMVIDRHHITHQTHCGAHFECQWTVPHNAPGVERSVALRRNENGQFVAGSSPLTVAEEVLFKDKQVSLTSAATFIMYRAMASRCRVGYIQADEECIVLAPIKDLAARALVYKKLKEMKLLTLTQAPLTVRENNVAAANIIKQKLHPVTASVVIETPNGDASITTCAESRNQLDYCDSAKPCSNIVELPTIGQPSRESPFPTGLRAQKRIRFAEVVGNAEEAYDDHALPWHMVTNLQKRAYDPETHLSYHIHGMPSLKSKLMLKDLVEQGEAVTQVNPMVAEFECATTNDEDPDVLNEEDTIRGEIPVEVIRRCENLPTKFLNPETAKLEFTMWDNRVRRGYNIEKMAEEVAFTAAILDELEPDNGILTMCKIEQLWERFVSLDLTIHELQAVGTELHLGTDANKEWVLMTRRVQHKRLLKRRALQKAHDLEWGRYPQTEPTPTQCTEKCSECSRRCSATFAHEHHSCRGCFEKDNEAVTCQECDRPLQDYAGSAKHHGKCPNCDAHVREEGVHEQPRRPEDELMSSMLPSIPDPPTSEEPTKQPEGLSGSSHGWQQ